VLRAPGRHQLLSTDRKARLKPSPTTSCRAITVEGQSCSQASLSGD
jgi:hypothetical protein